MIFYRRMADLADGVWAESKRLFVETFEARADSVQQVCAEYVAIAKAAFERQAERWQAKAVKCYKAYTTWFEKWYIQWKVQLFKNGLFPLSLCVFALLLLCCTVLVSLFVIVADDYAKQLEQQQKLFEDQMQQAIKMDQVRSAVLVHFCVRFSRLCYSCSC